MPTYEYKCSKDSEHKYEEVRGINEPQRRTTCAAAKCNGKLVRVFGTPPIMFKGTGFSSKSG